MSANKPKALGRLSFMMFLQYAVWGLWLPVLGRYLQATVAEGGLGFDPKQVGIIIGTACSIGAITAPFIAGQFADRHFRAERFLAFMLFAGGLIQIVLAQQTGFTAWLVLASLYSVLFMPTLSLSNSVAFANLTDSAQQFPKVRIWGTIGWIAASWIFSWVWLQSDLKFRALPPFLVGTEKPDVTNRLIDAMTFSGFLSIVYAAYCLMLPSVPPKKNAVEKLAFAKAFALMKRPSVFILVIASVAIAAIHQIYFIQTAQFLKDRGLDERFIGPAMTIGQFAELLVIGFLGLMLTKLKFRWTIVLGALAYFARYGIWAIEAAPLWLIVSSQALHGFCYACFFAATYIYIDRISPSDVRNSAQTAIGIMLLGVGPALSTFLFPQILELTGSRGGVINYTGLWGTLSAIGLGVALFVALGFKEEREPEPNPALVPEPEIA